MLSTELITSQLHELLNTKMRKLNSTMMFEPYNFVLHSVILWMRHGTTVTVMKHANRKPKRKKG